ncbi:MAG: MFS transporter [Candidatus Bathyarchaeota archaeon]|nr:MAG: MFS transporter [Candidatus Bathyarchaeota archaeon]
MSLYFVGLGGNPLMLGIMTATASIIGASMVLFGGVIADCYGRRPIIVTGAFYTGFFPFLYALTSDWCLFAVLSICAAIGSISTPALRTLVVDSVSPKRRTTGIAILQVISSLPAALSPIVGGWLIHNYGLAEGFRLACVYTGATFFLSALILFLYLKETLLHIPKQDIESSYLEKFKSVVRLPRSSSRQLGVLLFSSALVAFANGTVGPYYILYASSIVGLRPFQWAVIVSVQSFSIILKIPGAWLSDRVGKRNVMIFSIVACSPCTILFSLSRSFEHALIMATLLMIFGIYYAPAYEALQADLTRKELRGRITAFWQLSTTMASALGTLAGGFLYQVEQAMPFYLFSAIELLAATLLISFVKESK